MRARATMAPRPGCTREERDYYALNARVYPWLSRVYDSVTLPLARLRRQVVEEAAPGDRARVLDVATGTGGQALAFAARAAEVIGVDISRDMLGRASGRNRFANLSFQQADATALPFPDGAFDVSCVSFAMHEMPVSVRQRALREMARVTGPGGTLVIVDYGLPRNGVAAWLVYRLVKLYERDHYAEFVRGDLPAFAGAAGLEVLTVRKVLLGCAQIVIARVGFTPTRGV